MGGFRRLFRVLAIYIKARATADLLDQVHQYCRCVEGFVLPPVGATARKFKSRTELFIGAEHHDLMGDLYDIRSAVEHLNEHLYVTGAGREDRMDMLRKAAIIEALARHCLCRVVLSERL